MLRAARERRGVSLRQIANATKISVSVLDALERNDISRLPGGIFGRAFVRSYAVEVGLDPEATIQDFIAQFPHDSVTQGRPTVDQAGDNENIESQRRMAGTFLSLVAISIPIAAAVLYFGTSAGRRPTTRTAAAAAATATAAPAAPAAAPAETPPIATPPAATHEAPPPVVGTSARAIEPPAPSAAAAADVLSVGLSVKRPCWVSATVDGQKAIERLLAAGDRQTIEVRREIVLTAGDAAAIDLTLNGAEARALGKPGDVVTVRMNLANFKDYLQTR